VSSGEDALDVIGRRPTDIVLVDLMLPGIDGLELTRRIRRTNDVPIVVLTARNDTHDVVAGLEAGADDYVTKPFVVKELSARIRAHMRRAHGPSEAGSDSDRVVVGDLEVSQAEGAVRLGGVEAHLTRTEFRLLWELASSPGRVFSRETLLERVWGYDYFGDTRLVDVHVRRLRTKIEPDPSNPRYVVTVRGLGYKLAP
jgi:DNA-binding response OmpR family regulator